MATATSPNDTQQESVGTGQLIADAARDFERLMEQRWELAKAEARIEADRLRRGSILLLIGGGMALLAAAFLLVALAEGLLEAGMSSWGAYLVIALLAVVLAVGPALMGVKALKRVGDDIAT
jgi:hypothetical protein